jgi:hypothetical protein
MKYDDNGDDGNDSNDGENHDYFYEGSCQQLLRRIYCA